MSKYLSRDAGETQPPNLIAKLGFLLWVACAIVLYWLVHGPYGPLMSSPIVRYGRDLMLRYFSAPTVY